MVCRILMFMWSSGALTWTPQRPSIEGLVVEMAFGVSTG